MQTLQHHHSAYKLACSLLLLFPACSAEPLIVLLNELPGANCSNGGTAIQTGLDENRDGQLQEGEVTETSFVCNGEDDLLPALLEGSLTIANQADIDRAVQVEAITGDLVLQLAGLDSITLPNLALVEGQLITISIDGALASLPELLSAGSLQVDSALSAPKLTTTGDVSLGADAQALDLSSLQSASHLENLGGGFGQGSDGLTDLSLPALERLDSLRLTNNDTLETLSAPLLTQISEALVISNNPRLPTCQAQELAAQLAATPTDDVAISGNDDQGVCP